MRNCRIFSSFIARWRFKVLNEAYTKKSNLNLEIIKLLNCFLRENTPSLKSQAFFTYRDYFYLKQKKWKTSKYSTAENAVASLSTLLENYNRFLWAVSFLHVLKCIDHAHSKDSIMPYNAKWTKNGNIKTTGYYFRHEIKLSRLNFRLSGFHDGGYQWHIQNSV